VANLGMTFDLVPRPVIKIALTRQGLPFVRTRSLMLTNKAAPKEVAMDIHMANLENLQLVVRLSNFRKQESGMKGGAQTTTKSKS